MNTRFLFAVCRAGSETTLKQDVARRYAGKLTPAFMKPQFITWKSVGETDFISTGSLSVFARVAGTSLGLCQTRDDVVQHALTLSQRHLHLHVFPRNAPEDGLPEDSWARVDHMHQQLKSALTSAGISVITAQPVKKDDIILDVIIGEKEGEPLFAGWHVHQLGMHTLPGGLSRLQVSDQVPSRAWLKLEQALEWRDWHQKPWQGQSAIDLGCAPGGASYALVSRGMHVIGVDTGEMDERVYLAAKQHGGSFEHWRIPAGQIALSSLPERPEVLLCDINLAPNQVIPMVERVQKYVQAKRLVLTLKLNTSSLEDRSTEFIEAVSRFAPGPVYATQLAGNRREICVTSCAE